MSTINDLRKAWSLAAHHHTGQTYGGSQPGQSVEYLEHIGAVLLEATAALAHHPAVDGRVVKLCAILHDILEDTDCDPEQLKVAFGETVLQGVQALSKNPTIAAKDEQMVDSLQRIQQAGPAVAIVKLADRICNLAAPPHYWSAEKMAAYLTEAQLILDTLGGHSPYLANRLHQRMVAYRYRNVPIALRSKGRLTSLLKAVGRQDWDSAVKYVQALTYGRTSRRSDLSLVLTEKCGTCSSKHALLKALALENELQDVRLILCMYKMSVANTPGIGTALHDNNLGYIPEAHCYVAIGDEKWDITNPQSDMSRIQGDILVEREIDPAQVGDFKVTYHKDYIRRWAQEENLSQSPGE
ncbi:MAG: HD domain-containing protein, partial [Bacteroidota bacterium]